MTKKTALPRLALPPKLQPQEPQKLPTPTDLARPSATISKCNTDLLLRKAVPARNRVEPKAAKQAAQYLGRCGLVLSRKKNERIMIGDNIVLTIVEIRGDKVRIGIDAPNSMPVHREEVYHAIRRKLEEAKHEDAKREETSSSQEASLLPDPIPNPDSNLKGSTDGTQETAPEL